MRNGDEIEYPAILAQMDKGEDVDIVEAVNAQRWRMNNQRREIAKLHAKAEALTHQRDRLAEALRKCGRHQFGCSTHVNSQNPCNCGFADVLISCGSNEAREP